MNWAFQDGEDTNRMRIGAEGNIPNKRNMKKQKKERGSPSWETKQKVCVEQKEMRKGRKLRLIYSGPQMPTKESGLSSEETMPKKNSNLQTQTNSSEARKSPGNVNVCSVGVGVLRHKE